VVPPLEGEPLEAAPAFWPALVSLAEGPVVPLPVVPVVAVLELGAVVPLLLAAWLSLVSVGLAVAFGVVALPVPAVAWPPCMLVLDVPAVRLVLPVPFVSLLSCAHAASPMIAAAASVVPRLSFM
jgi:hypothetical protein